MQLRRLTGITASGTPHLGNYIGAFRPAIAHQSEGENLFFIADYHSLIKLFDPKRRAEYIDEIAATWLALGLDPIRTIFYRQSQVPEILELTWILTTVAAKGLLNRAHAYKDQVAKNEADTVDPDLGITMGLFNYPILMAADILAFNAHQVPVGRDQIQHIEIARDIAQRFNHLYGNLFVLPTAITPTTQSPILPGLDGRKMSKSYDNTIPLFLPPEALRKLIMKIKTNSQAPSEPKSTEGCTLFSIYQNFASPEATERLRQCYLEGIGWGDVKSQVFEVVNTTLAEPRRYYDALMSDRAEIHRSLAIGAEKAREIAALTLQEAKCLVGISKISAVIS